MLISVLEANLGLTYFVFNIRRKTPGSAGNKKALEVNLPESSRKFITCIRKYLLFYLKLLEETGDRCILERSYAALRADKRVNSIVLIYCLSTSVNNNCYNLCFICSHGGTFIITVSCT